MNKQDAIDLAKRIIVARGAVRKENFFCYSTSEEFIKNKELKLPFYLINTIEFVDINECGIQLSFWSDHVYGIRTKLNPFFVSKLHKIRVKIKEEFNLELGWADDPLGFQFSLTKNYWEDGESFSLESVEKELLIVGGTLLLKLSN